MHRRESLETTLVEDLSRFDKTCQVPLWKLDKFYQMILIRYVTSDKNNAGSNNWESLACQRIDCDIFLLFFGCSGLSKIIVFGWTRHWHNTPPTFFFDCLSRYKQSRSGKRSTQKTGIIKETDSEKISRQQRRASQCGCWLRVVHMFPESKVFWHDKFLRKLFVNCDNSEKKSGKNILHFPTFLRKGEMLTILKKMAGKRKS